MKRALRIMLCRLRRTHGRELDGWGYRHGTGLVDLYCDGCGAKFGQVPLDDFDGADDVLAAMAYRPEEPDGEL